MAPLFSSLVTLVLAAVVSAAPVHVLDDQNTPTAQTALTPTVDEVHAEHGRAVALRGVERLVVGERVPLGEEEEPWLDEHDHVVRAEPHTWMI